MAIAREKTGGIYFKVTDEERKLIEQKMEQAGIHNMSAYIRKMCIDGYVIRLELPELTECAKYLRRASANMNQIAKRVNSGGGYSPGELDGISTDLAEGNQKLGEILEQLSKLK